MKTKFTKGPWSFYESETCLGDFICNIHQSDGAPYTSNYSDIATTIAGEKKDIQLANAYLIKAAPKMYKFLDDLASGRGTDYPIEKLLEEARGE